MPKISKYVVELTEPQIYRTKLSLESNISSMDNRNHAGTLIRVVEALGKAAPVALVEDRGFMMGVAYAVAILIRAGDITIAQEIWEASSPAECGVPTYIDSYDAKVIRRSIKNGWVK